MDDSVLEKSALFAGVPAKKLRAELASVPHHIQHYEKGETVFHLLETADRIGLILKGRVQAQKPFPNGSQINVSVGGPGELIGAAAVFSRGQTYPCDIVSLEPGTIMMFRRSDMLLLLQKDSQIMGNFMAELATATYMLQQRLELLSYHGIAQKAAFWLLMQIRQAGTSVVKLPGSMSKWAMIMNVSRPSLYREIKKLEECGIIRYTGKTIEVSDQEALQSVLSA